MCLGHGTFEQGFGGPASEALESAQTGKVGFLDGQRDDVCELTGRGHGVWQHRFGDPGRRPGRLPGTAKVGQQNQGCGNHAWSPSDR